MTLRQRLGRIGCFFRGHRWRDMESTSYWIDILIWGSEMPRESPNPCVRCGSDIKSRTEALWN